MGKRGGSTFLLSFCILCSHPTAGHADEVSRYRYDALGRLIVADVRGGNGGNFTEYQHDKAGNRTAVNSSGPHLISVLSPGVALWSGQMIISADKRFRLALERSGNLVLYDESDHPIWSTNTTGAIYLFMQPDGHLVLYNSANQPLWYTAIYGYPGAQGAFAALQIDGNFVVYSGQGSPVWATGTCCL